MAALTILVAAASWLPISSQAALKCEELELKRVCTDSAPKPYEASPGQVVYISAPIIPGFTTPCWNWSRQFQCIETNPIYTCESGTAFNTVKKDCSLTSAVVNATTTINSVNYITDASYSYRCAFGEFTTDDKLPLNKECVILDSTTVDSKTVSAAAPGSNPQDPLNSTVVTEQTRTDEYVCYSPAQTVCSDVCYENVVDPISGKMEQKEVACKSPVTNCTASSNQCNGSLSGDLNNIETDVALGPDGRCVSSTEQQLCQSGEVPRCLTQDNCQLTETAPSSIQDNGVALTQEQTYICSNEVTTCTQLTQVSNCMHVGAWGWDNLSIASQMGTGLGEFNQAMSKLEGIQKGMQDNDPYIFSGQDLRCHYAVGNFWNTFISVAFTVAAIAMTGGAGVGLGAQLGLTAGQQIALSAAIGFIQDAPNSKAFGSNCCKDYVIEGSDKWYKLGSCSADEVKLAVAKRKNLTHYLGEYCSKKAGFPLRMCVEKTKSYCVFDDMLALTVNEQGRAQLNAIASADPINTKSVGPLNFKLYTAEPATAPTKYDGVLNDGKWVRLVQTSVASSQVWYWQYPSYCASPEKQKVAYDLYMAELQKLADTKGIQTGEMTEEQAAQIVRSLLEAPDFQECPSTLGQMSVLTCSKADDSCDTSKLPEGPTGVDSDLSGTNISQADVNWRIQQSDSYYMPGDYGVTSVMPSNSTFAAVSFSVNEFITATGSCHVDGACLYQLAITDKTKTGGLGARKRVKEYVNFPLYTAVQTSAWPAVTYVAQDGTMDLAAYQADPNRGRADPTVVSSQRFIFHPNYLTAAPSGNIHAALLMEYASKKGTQAHPEDDYKPLLLPTSLPPGTPGWYPYGDPKKPGEYFYISGGCDPNSRWCSYEIEVDLNVPRHPWGSAQSPRCWGFSLEQMAALDFDRMDLSRWINSLDLSAASSGLSTEAAQAMTEQVTNTAQSFYSSFSTGAVTNKPDGGSVALIANTDILPKLTNDSYKAYTLEIGVPANWPNWFTDAPNNNPVTNVWVDWGDGSPKQSMSKHSTGRAYMAEHDYGDKPVGTYKVTVTLDTFGNGPQTLTTKVSLTPNSGQVPVEAPLDFNAPGANGKVQSEYIPSDTLNGLNQAPENLQQLSPGTADQFQNQGSTINK